MRFITLNDENIVISLRYGSEIVYGEIESELGELGQIMQEDGSFITPEIEPIESIPSIEEEILFENKYQTMLLETGGMM